MTEPPPIACVTTAVGFEGESMTGTYETTWTHKDTGERVRGSYSWNRGAQCWEISLDVRCKYFGHRITGRSFNDDAPNFGPWIAAKKKA